jgi:hypothetical protein
MEEITDKIKSFEDACKHLGLNPNDLPVVDMLPEKDRKSIIAYYKLTIITRALNEGWEPDFSNWNEYKYYNWFYVEENKDQRSSGFRSDVTCYSGTGTDIGSRLCFKNRELAKYATEQFKELYREYLLIL